VETARVNFEREGDRLRRARLPDRRLDRRHLGRRLERQRCRVEPPPQILRLHRQPLAQCLHSVLHMRLPTLFAAAQPVVPYLCPEDVNRGEAGLRQPLKLLDCR
jgi:hypothetical protein